MFDSLPRWRLDDGVVVVIVEAHIDVASSEVIGAPPSTCIFFFAFLVVAESALLFNAARERALLQNDASTFASVNKVLVDAL